VPGGLTSDFCWGKLVQSNRKAQAAAADVPSRRRQLLLSTATLVTAITGYGRAYASGPCLGVGATYHCSGSATANTTGESITHLNAEVIADPGFGLNTTDVIAISITGDGTLSYTDVNYSPLTASQKSLYIKSTGDDGGTPGSVTVKTNGTLNGNVVADNRGNGALSVTANGNVTGPSYAIYARNSGTDLTVTTGPGTTATGGLHGLAPRNFGSGALTVIANGNVTGTANYGIYAVNDAAGTTTNLTVTTGAGTKVEGGRRGMFLINYDGGAVKVIANGDVTGKTSDGIYARNSDNTGTDLTVTTAAGTTVIGGKYGIRARNNGSGVLDITTNGDVTGTNFDGIFARHYSGGPINITVGPASTVTSNSLDPRFAIITLGGATNLTVAGTLNGGGGGAVKFDGSEFNNRLELRPTATINGNVLAGPGTDTLAFGGTGAGTFDLAKIDTSTKMGQFQEFEKFEVDSGEWSFTGDTTAPFTVTGGTVKGTGTFGDLTVNGGTVAPGNSIGTFTVIGAFTLAAGAVYEVEVNAAGQSDKVIVNGTVNLTGATLRVLAANGNYKTSTEYTIIENDGSDAVVGKFSQVTSSLAFLTPTVVYNGGDGNDVVLNLERIFGPGGSPLSFCSVANTSNQCNVAKALDQFPTNNALFLAVLNQTAEGARQAFDALSGEIHATVAGTLADDSRYVREAVLGRLMQANVTGGGNSQVAALAAAGPQVASLDSNAMALGYGGKSLSAPAASPLAFWTQGFGAWGDFNGDGNAATADRDLGGFISGMDANIGGSWRAGLATGASFSNVDVDARYSSADVESYHLGGYLGGMAGSFALRGGGMWAWSDIDTSRAVVFPGFFERQTASYDADTGQLFGEVAYPTQMGGIALEPFGGLAFVSVDTGTFRERGGRLASLRGLDTDQDVGYSTLGLRAASTMHWGATLVTPHLSAAWQHAFDDVTPDAALAFASTGIGFGIEGVPLAEDSALIDAGLDFALGERTTAGLSYTGQFGDGVQDNGVKGRFTWLF